MKRTFQRSPCHGVSPAVSTSSGHAPLFFFSSRRRHTRCLSDWSSDVCSSDLKSELMMSPASRTTWRGFSVAVAPPPRLYRIRSGDLRALANVSNLVRGKDPLTPDRKSTRLNSSHLGISYAVFCLKKKKQQQHH